MNDLFLTTMNRRARNSVERQRKNLRRRARDGLHRVLGTVDALVAANGTDTIGAFRDAQNPPALIEAAIACRAYERLEARGHLDAMLARYGTLRHTFALGYLRDNPGKLVELASLLGHESLDTTAVYTRPSRDDLAADLERSHFNVGG